MVDVTRILRTANHAIIVQQPTNAPSAGGARKLTGWTDVATFQPCWVQPASSQVRLVYQERQLRVSHRVYFVSDPGVDVEWRLKFGTRVFKVAGGACPGELGRFWYVDCEETKQEP